MQIIRQTSFTAAPWKNGGGITHEAIRVPATGDSFRWRLSVAHIDASGPFSDFAGYNRKMVLLRGAGLALKFAGGERRILRHIGELAEFDGALSTCCELLNGPCVDLNLMVSKSARAQVRIERLGYEIAVHASPLEPTLIFSIEDPLLVMSDTGETQQIEPWDLVVLSQCGARVSRMRPGNLSAPSAVFFATISD
ncbi:MAG: HutD family protein [Steroidobacteraceae bacterium]